MSETKALIVGAGPSLQKNLDEYKRLGKFPGLVIATDASLHFLLERDIIPDCVATLEDSSALVKYYIHDVVKEKGRLVKKGWVSDRVAGAVRKSMEEASIHPVVAAKARDSTTSNVGLYCWLISHLIEECNSTYLIGMDHCYAADNPPPVERDGEIFFWGFYTLYNPYDKIEIQLNPAHELWQEEFHWSMTLYPDIKVTNCTGWGALYGKGITWTPIKSMQSW